MVSNRLHSNPKHDQYKIIHSIENIVPLCAMPDSVRNPHWEQGDCRSHQSCNMFSAMLSSILVPFLNQSGYRYRIENICLEPRAECNMPSAPEFRRILRTERLSEVFWKADTKQLSTSYNDIHTTGEFHIKLNHITNRCRKNHCSMIVCIMVKHLIYHQCHTVCYHHLFKESPEDSYITIDHISIFQWLSCIQSICHI